MSLLELFCDIDDFCQTFEPTFQQLRLASGQIRRQRAVQMSLSEMLTIVVHFHQRGYRNFKTYYLGYVGQHLRAEFPKQLSYSRFIQLLPRLLLALVAYLRHCYGACTGLAFIDSTALAVCDNHRIAQYHVFDGTAQRGNTSLGWFLWF